MLLDIYEEKKSAFSVILLESGSIDFLQVLRVSNPLETNLSFITIFGSQLLALNEQGDKMLIWNTSDGGNYFSFQYDRDDEFITMSG